MKRLFDRLHSNELSASWNRVAIHGESVTIFQFFTAMQEQVKSLAVSGCTDAGLCWRTVKQLPDDCSTKYIAVTQRCHGFQALVMHTADWNMMPLNC